jgi:hypothetical protein
MHCSPVNAADERAGFELRFESLFDSGRSLAFPCDAEGDVDLGALSTRARHNYLQARATIGRNYGVPLVLRSALH